VKLRLTFILVLCSVAQLFGQGDTGNVHLPFPIHDYYDYTQQKNSPINLADPSNLQTEIIYNPSTGQYEIYQKIGSLYYRYPTSMTMDEYMEFQRKQAENKYMAEKVDEQNQQQRGLIPPIKMESEAFDVIFGGNEINIRPQGSAELSFGVNISRYDNPVLPVKQRRVATFDFQQKINLNLVGQIGDKLKLTIQQNTEATFNFENVVKIEYTGYEDEIIQKIEAGNVSLPLNSTLIQGSQSLFGIRTDLKFGPLTVQTVLSQQRGKQQEINVTGGAQVQDYEVYADNYEANKHYFLNYYHRNHYDTAMMTMPIVNSGVNITKIEVWVTNRINKVENTRNIIGFTDLGETKPEYCEGNPIQFNGQFPDNEANELYDVLSNASQVREFSNAVAYLSTYTGIPGPFNQSQHYEKVENARQLSDQEFTYNSQLGFISLKSPLNQDEVLAVAYQYTYAGRTYQVGEFTTDVPVQEGSKSALILKLIKPTIINPNNITWDLMMKNVYSIGAYQVSPADFILDVWYNNPMTSTDINYLPYDGVDNKLLMQQVDLDRLNLNNGIASDGRFDYVPIQYDNNRAINGGTIDPKTGRVYFTTIEPFGTTLSQKLSAVNTLAPTQIESIVFQELYDSTKTAAQQIPGKNRFKLKGSYKSSVSSEISLNALNIPEGSVVVTAGGRVLNEGVDYTVDYNLGRVKILDQGILEAQTPISVKLESNSVFGFQSKSMVGAHFNYEFNKDFNVGATVLNLTEKPLTQKVNIGDEPISNTVLGTDIRYRSEFPFLTKAVDLLPVISTKEKSFITADGEFAYLIPGTQRAISKEGISYIDGFEGSQSAIDIKTWGSWKLASIPQGQPDLFPEASIKSGLVSGFNRSHLSWYVIDPTAFYQNSSTTPEYMVDNPLYLENSQMHMLAQTDLFPQYNPIQGTLNNIPVFDLAYYPAERGPYNYDTVSTFIDADGYFTNPEDRWGGIMRSLTTTNFEQANIQFIQFWLLDPFNNDATDTGSVNMTGGNLYFNLGNISEDILPDSRKSFENGMPASATFDPGDYDTTSWAAVPNQQVIVNAFDNNTSSREFQDIGLDGLDNDAEQQHFQSFLNWVNSSGLTPAAKQKLLDDPSGDYYNYYLDDDYDVSQLDIVERYKYYNGTEGNSPTSEMASAMNAEGYPTQSTTTPDIEDLNQDNNLSETESYFQYEVSLRPQDLVVGQNFITNSQVVEVNEDGKTETWYQFKIPIETPDAVINGISDFRSIRFMRMYVNGFEHPVVLRFAKLELIRGEWRKYLQNIDEPGEQIQDDPNATEFNISAVNLEENNLKQPVNYCIPPGIQRQQDNASINFRQLNEQALALQVCGLKDGEARATYKNVTFDVRSYEKLRMFVHAEARNIETNLQDDQLTVFIRLGTDFENNYYEYEIPVQVTPWGTTFENDLVIWPEANNIIIAFDSLINMKMKRNTNGISSALEYIINVPTESGKMARMKLKGNPNLQGLKVIMIGVRNPGKDTNHPWMYAEDGLDKCAEIWVNELRLTDFDQHGGWASTARVGVQLADFGNVNVSGSYSTPGWGSIEKKVSERQRDTRSAFDFSTSVELGQFLGSKMKVQVPFLYGYSVNAIDPQFDLLAPDIRLSDYTDLQYRQERAKMSRDITRRTYYNFTNVRRERPTGKEVHVWDIENWSATYSFNELYQRDLNTDHDITRTYRGALNYNFSGKPIAVEPFKDNAFFKKSKWFGLIKEFNFNLGPKSISFSSEITRMYNERQNRNLLDTVFVFQPTYLKNFTWVRNYDLKYDFTKQLKFTFTAVNNAIIFEPNGGINGDADPASQEYANYLLFREGIDKVFNPFSSSSDTTNSFGGYNMNYGHNYNITYKIPFQQLPLTDWLTTNIKYRGSYDWMRAPIAQPQFGHTIQNSSNFNVSGQADFGKIYNRLEFFRRVNGGQPQRGGRVTEKESKDKEDDGGEGEEGKKDESEKKKEKGELHPAWKVVGQMIMTLQSATFTYSETDGMLLPGFNNASTLLGMNNFGAPGFGFVAGRQNYDLWGRPISWGDETSFAPYAAANGWLVQNPLLNVQHTITHTQSINGKITLMPFKDLNINLTIDRKYTNNENGYYRYNDTLVTPDGIGYWDYQNQVNMGSLSFTTITWKTAFSKMDSTYFSNSFNDMREYRDEVSAQLGQDKGTSLDPTTGFYDGFGNNQQDVLIGSFFAAYTGKGSGNKFFDVFSAMPLPNWDIRYNGLSKFEFMKKRVKNFTISHAYRSNVSVSNFQTNLAAFDDLGNQNRDVSNNFIAGRQIQSITVTEQFAPLIGLDATWTIGENGLITKLEFTKDRSLALNIPNMQIMEMRGREIVIGSGYKFSKVKMPFKFMGKTPESDLNIRFDLNIRNNISIARNIIEDTNQPTAGTKTYSLKFRVDYNLGPNLNAAVYFDRVVNTPVLSNAYPTANTSAGISLRFNLAQ